jgi:phenylacetic acid degradation operon negative regulatory protein
MNQMSKLDTFIQQAVEAMPISGTSLIALYGDSLLQRGGEVWLGSVAALLEGLGFGERFVRTALFRLNKEEWLDVVRIGRRSFYRLSDKGLRLTRRAEHKIYRASAPEWDGTWLLLLSEGLEKSTLAEVKKQLLWQGFGALAPSLLASPSQKLADVQSLLHEAGVAENVICFEAHSPLALSRAALRARVEECWHLTEQNAMYDAFIALFRPLLPLLRDCGRRGANAATLLSDPAAADPFLSPGGAERSAAAGRAPACALGRTNRAPAVHQYLSARCARRAGFVGEKAKARWGNCLRRGRSISALWRLARRIRRLMPIYQIDGMTPVVPDESYVHPTAVLIGDVILGKGVYVGPNASLRGDFGRIVVKDGANIQDNCVMHGFPGQDTVVEEDGHIGHGAILHGCTIGRNALVGMSAVIIDGARPSAKTALSAHRRL